MSQMVRMLGFYLLFSLLPLLGLAVAGQEEALELIHLHETNPLTSPSFAISVSKEDLPLVYSSVLEAESWLKSHVLAHYPSTNFSTIVVGRGILCNKHYENHWSLVLPTVKNLYYSLTRWGLSKEIKVSAAFSFSCFEVNAAEDSLKPLLNFLDDNSLPYTIYPSPHLGFSRIRNITMRKPPRSIDKKLAPFDFHQDFLEKLGFLRFRDIRMIKGSKPMKRMLSSLRTPRPPSMQFAPVPGSSFSFAPESVAFEGPANPPDVSLEPPLQFCLPPGSGPAPTPTTGEGEKVGLWCVAKPAVPEEKLQEAMDFACGEGGADCEEIRPNGSCFNPDNLVAHASYAFNSYWQKTKQIGGSCNFDGTAILINSDPSFLHCRFKLS